MKTKIRFILFTLLAFVAFTSCEENNYDSYPPTWWGFRFAPYPPVAGDSLKITAVQSKKGHLINATSYTWTLTCNIVKENNLNVDTVLTFRQKTNYDGISNADPTCGFLVPENAEGYATVSFEAVYAFSGAGIQGTSGNDYERPEGIYGNINSTSAAMTGSAKGTYRFRIVK